MMTKRLKMFIWLQGDSEADTFITMRNLSGDTKDALLMNDFTIYTTVLYLLVIVSPTLSSPVLTFLRDSRIIGKCHHLLFILCSPLFSIYSVTKSLSLLTLGACSGLAGLT